MLIQIPLSTSADSHPPLVSFLTPVDILHATYISYLVFISLLTILRYFNLLIEINSSKVIFLKWKRKKKKPQQAKHACRSSHSMFISTETAGLTSLSKMSSVLLKLFYVKGFWWVTWSFNSVSRIPGCSVNCSGAWRCPWTSDLLALPPRADYKGVAPCPAYALLGPELQLL